MSLDVLIVNGRIVDGTGAPERPGALGIRDGRIVPPTGDARTVIDASGKVVAPGFVDVHSHGDLVLAWPSEARMGLLEGRLAQGITTEIVGNCGLGAAPLFGSGKDLLPALNGWMAPADYEWPWSDLNGYLEHLESTGLPANVGSLVPHGALRLGAQALEPGETNGAVRRRMSRQLDEALEQGAYGLSSGLIYPPGMYTSTSELVELARRLARHDALFTSHIRGSSETLLEAVSELVGIGRDACVRVHHSHIEAVGRHHWRGLDRALAIEDSARAEGIAVTADMFPYTVAATMMLAIYPPWTLEGGVSALLDRLRDRGTRERIRVDVETASPQWPPWRPGGWPHNLVKAVGWERILVASVASEANRDAEGRSLTELGASRGRHPFDAVSDLMLEEEGNVGQFVLDVTGEDGLRQLIRRPEIAFITDANDYGKGKPHPAAYGGFPRILGRYVRDESLLDLPEAVRRMTSLPASIVGLDGRGSLTEGAFADVVVFDDAAIRDRATLGEPRRQAAGIDLVLVNGELVYRNGTTTGATPGRALRRS